jgi:small-conductance mechanosensitive channel
MTIIATIVATIIAADTGARIQAGIIIAAAIVGAFAASWLVRRLLRGHSQMIASLLARAVGGFVFIAGLVYALNSVGVAIGPLLGALGVAGFAVAFALKDILANILAGVLIQIRRPFEIGHLVKIGDYLGRVDDVTLRTVVMSSVTGEQIIIPCAHVIDGSIENWSANRFRRADVTVGIDDDADVDRAVEILTAAVADIDGAQPDLANKVIIDGFGGSSVDIRMLVWHDLDEVHFLDFRHRVARAAKYALDDAGIGIPFPIRTLDVPDGSPLAALVAAE